MRKIFFYFFFFYCIEICFFCEADVADFINRDFPSTYAAWGNILNKPELTPEARWAMHDVVWSADFGLRFNGVEWIGYVEAAHERKALFLSMNPDMLFFVDVRYFSGYPPGSFPADNPMLLRDSEGVPVVDELWGNEQLLDFTLPETQQWAIKQAVAAWETGLFDGIFLDNWNEDERLNALKPLSDEHKARDLILQGIRSKVGSDFLIIVNSGHKKIPRWAAHVNGLHMETRPGYSNIGIPTDGNYTQGDLDQIQETLIWAEASLREPVINCLEGVGEARESPMSIRNQRQMRFFTTMSLTLSDGCVLFALGSVTLPHIFGYDSDLLYIQGIDINASDHYWYNFWDANLGRPIGTKGQLYDEREGLFIREFTNGWAVYNRSGKEQTIEFPEEVSGVASGVTEKRSHVLPDLDGEIYLKSESGLETPPTVDVNGDGTVNILDLVAVANAFGKDAPDVNGDGTVNVLDLVSVANAFE